MKLQPFEKEILNKLKGTSKAHPLDVEELADDWALRRLSGYDQTEYLFQLDKTLTRLHKAGLVKHVDKKGDLIYKESKEDTPRPENKTIGKVKVALEALRGLNEEMDPEGYVRTLEALYSELDRVEVLFEKEIEQHSRRIDKLTGEAIKSADKIATAIKKNLPDISSMEYGPWAEAEAWFRRETARRLAQFQEDYARKIAELVPFLGDGAEAVNVQATRIVGRSVLAKISKRRR